jgi:outer membrane protein assembly factor BamD
VLKTGSTKRVLLLACVATMFGLVLAPDCPAPLIWRKGEGWTYEKGGVTTGKTPKEQLDLAKQLQAQKSYGDAATAYRRLIRRWPTSYVTADARIGLAECLSAMGYHYKAFVEFQQLIEKHPNTERFDEVLQKEFEIGNLFLAGEKHRVWKLKIFSGLDKAAEIFEKLMKNGPYSKIAPEAQFHLGLVREKQKDYLGAVHAYEKLLERYPNHPLAEAAQYEIANAYSLEAGRAEYDQDVANRAVAAFDDFLTRYPQSDKISLAEQHLAALKLEQARGLFRIGEFYEKKKEYRAALIYFNEVIEQNPKSDWANAAKDKVARLTSQTAESTATP